MDAADPVARWRRLVRAKTVRASERSLHMWQLHFNRTLLPAFFIVCCFVTAAAQPKPAQTSSACPDEKTWTGRYRNYVYGFSLTIPEGLKGYWNSGPCATDEKYGCLCVGEHGRFIPLAGDAYIEAFVGYQMESEWSLRDHEQHAISFLTDDKQNDAVSVLRSHRFRLGNLQARRFQATFRQNTKPMMVDHIVALHEGVEYELILVTSPDRYNADRREFEKVIASWRLTPRV